MCLITISVDVRQDHNILQEFNDKESSIQETMKNYEIKVAELSKENEYLKNYIDEKIEKEVNKVLIEFYKQK